MSSEKRRKNRIQGGWSKESLSGKNCLKLKENIASTSMSSSHETCDTSNQIIASSPKQPSGHNYLFKDPKQYRMAGERPPNFSWVVDGLLAGSGLPSRGLHLQYMINHGITHLVSLTEWKPVLHACPGLKHTHMAVEEFAPPNLKQAIDFVQLVETAKAKNECVCVHCHWGLGRTGTMLACCIMKAGDLTAEQAMGQVRGLRPYSIETHHQEDLVKQYATYLHQQSKQTQ